MPFMPGRILIVDTIATNRIVLKVKMLAAQFAVDTCADREDAEILIATNRPDLILINLSDPLKDQHAFCKMLRNAPDTAAIAIIAVGVADTSQARFKALDAGADDVLAQPMNDALLLARIRSLLRVRSAHQELALRDSTSRALGFEEPSVSFEAAAQVAILTPAPQTQHDLLSSLTAGLRHQVRLLDTAGVLKDAAVNPVPDLFVVDATHADGEDSALFSLISDLRSRAETRLATQLVIVPPDNAKIAAMFLDLGADDVVFSHADPSEIVLRAKALVRRKLQQDRLRATVRDGLHAAVTDPLTGLYNRRYVDPHLTRLAEQSRASGRALAVMMIDIDHFKSVNDTYGHAAGDAILIQLSDRLKENLRAIDLVARMGGEEFLVAMPRTTVKQAKLAADRLRRLVNNAPFGLGRDGPGIKITVSIGVAISDHTTAEPHKPNQMCEQADAALYAAKSAGRNQVAMSKSAA
jgi:two-component system cell cycle response regulator